MSIKADDVLRYIADKSEYSQADISRRLHKASSYVSATLARKSVPTLNSVAKIADAAGFQLILADKHGNKIDFIIPNHERYYGSQTEEQSYNNSDASDE